MTTRILGGKGNRTRRSQKASCRATTTTSRRPPTRYERSHTRKVNLCIIQVQYIRGAADERAFYEMKSLHFEKLKGDRKEQHSMKLNDQWRLIVKLEKKSEKTVVEILSIEDYH